MSNVFNDVLELDSGNGNITLLKGIAARSDIGFLSLFEHYNVCQVPAGQVSETRSLAPCDQRGGWGRGAVETRVQFPSRGFWEEVRLHCLWVLGTKFTPRARRHQVPGEVVGKGLLGVYCVIVGQSGRYCRVCVWWGCLLQGLGPEVIGPVLVSLGCCNQAL